MGRTLAGSPAKSYVTTLFLVGLTACAAAQRSTPAAGARRLHNSGAELNSIGFEGSSSSGSNAAEFASELDSLPRLLQEQMDEGAAVAAAAAVHRAGQAGELSTPGAYGSSANYSNLDSPNAQTGSDDGITITSDDAISDESETMADDSTSSTRPTLEAATRDPSQSVSGTSSPMDSLNSEGKVVEQLSGGQTAGIVVGVLIAAGVVALGVFGYQKYKKNKQGDDYITRYRRYDGEIEMH